MGVLKNCSEENQKQDFSNLYLVVQALLLYKVTVSSC